MAPKASASVYGINDLWSSYGEPGTVLSFAHLSSHLPPHLPREEIVAIVPGAWRGLPVQGGTDGQGRAGLHTWTHNLCTILPPEIEGHILVPALLPSGHVALEI